MSKIDDARDILEQLGLPQAQRNDISCLTLLALTGLSEDDAWSQASRQSRSIHQILGFMRDVYEREYAENTRETVRRQVIHQFEQARIVDRNPDEPDLPTNSPRTHYGLTDDALKVLRLYQTGGWESELQVFRSSHGALLEIYQRRRRMREIPIRTSTGEEIRLSPGRHNVLQGQVVTDFGPRFAPGSTLLYLGDAADKLLHLDKDKLADLGVPITEHDKLPDVVLYDEERNWLCSWSRPSRLMAPSVRSGSRSWKSRSRTALQPGFMSAHSRISGSSSSTWTRSPGRPRCGSPRFLTT